MVLHLLRDLAEHGLPAVKGPDRLATSAFPDPGRRTSEAQASSINPEPQGVAPAPSATASAPDTPVELDLGSVRASALKNNLNIQVELLSIDSAQATLEEARAITDPTLSASLNRSSNNSPAAQDTQGSQNDNSSASLGLTMPLGAGDSLDVRLPWFRSSTNAAFSLSSYNAAQLDVTYRSPLTKGRGVKNFERGIRIAQTELDLTVLNTRLSITNTLANAERAYWTWYAAGEAVAVAKERVQLAEDQIARAERRVRAGASAELEVLRAKSGLSSAQESLLNADVNHRNAERALRAAMRRPDLPLGQQGGLTPNTLPDPSVRSLDREALVTLAKSERAEIAQHQGRLSNLQERLEGALETTNASRWILLPVGADRASATPLKTRSNPSTTVVNGHSASTRPCLWEISPRRPKPDRHGWPDFERSARGLPSWIRSNVKFLMRPTATKARANGSKPLGKNSK